MRRPLSSKPELYSESMVVDAAGISVKVETQYPGRSPFSKTRGGTPALLIRMKHSLNASLIVSDSCRCKIIGFNSYVVHEPPWYGTVRPVVWEDGGGDSASCPMGESDARRSAVR